MKKTKPESVMKTLAKCSMEIGSTGGMGNVNLTIRQKTDDGTSTVLIKTEVSSIGSTGTTVIETNAAGLVELAAIFRIAATAAAKAEKNGSAFSDDFIALREE